ncbi:MAG: glutaminase, partial [Pseudomonadota bacterium]
MKAPSANRIQTLTEAAVAAARDTLGQGTVASYIPALEKIDANQLGMAVATVDGNIATAGDAQVPFSVQSISKVFTLTLALEAYGDSLWESVGREPSGTPFNSIVQLESEAGRPRNPLINAGAIATSDR